MTEDEQPQESTRDIIIKTYMDLVRDNLSIPSYNDFKQSEAEIKRDSIRYHFGNIEELHNFMSSNYKQDIEQYFSTVDNLFQPVKASEFTKKTFVVTTAVADSRANLDFLDAIDNYCDRNDGQVIIMPCESVTNSFENRTATFDKVFSDRDRYKFIHVDTELNSNLSLCSIQISAKQIKPITGLTRIGRREGSYIFASPKQFLEYVPCGNSRIKNYAIMTPGACTYPEYYTETFVSKRLSYIAKNDHTMGAIIVEVENNKYFHFRQIQCNEDGAFIDLGKQYNADGSVEDVPVYGVYGDIHTAQAEKKVVDKFSNLLSTMDTKAVFLHDIFDGNTINHHETTIASRTKRLIDTNGMSLEDEVVQTRDMINSITDKSGTEKTYIVKSNHDEFLDRYLKEGRYIDDPQNHYFSLKIATSLFENVDVLKRAIWKAFGSQDDEPNESILNGKVEFLTRDDTIEIGGIHLSSHGDLGLNGARASMSSLEKIYGRCVTAHNHGAAIQRSVFRVGTFTKLDMGYNRGPSSWTHTGALVYENGQVQLVNFVNGKFHKNQNKS